MKIGDKALAQFRTLPDNFPRPSATDEEKFPIRTGTVVYIHPRKRFVTLSVTVDGKEIRESFLPQEVMA